MGKKKDEKRDFDEAAELLSELEHLFNDHIETGCAAISGAKSKGDPNIALLVNRRHTFIYYRNIIWRLRRALCLSRVQ